MKQTELFDNKISVVSLLQKFVFNASNVTVCQDKSQCEYFTDFSELNVAKLKSCHGRQRDSSIANVPDNLGSTFNFLHKLRIDRPILGRSDGPFGKRICPMLRVVNQRSDFDNSDFKRLARLRTAPTFVRA